MKAPADHPVNELIANRWSPYSFSDKPVSDEVVRSLFEAARWAPSSYNEQPWYYILAKKESQEEFDRLVNCLWEANRDWASFAPVLAIGVSSLNFTRNDKPNRAAIHDLGLASGNIVIEATARGLHVHQMIGIYPEKVKEVYHLPDGYEPMTGIAIGYVGDRESLPEAIRKRDLERRPRKALHEFVFGGAWGPPSRIIS